MIIALIAAAAATAAPETVRCTIDERPVAHCRLTDVVLADGRHRLIFTGQGARVVFEGKGANGWWSGMLDGRPAMGYERNRGNVVFATRDLTHSFAWWYPADAHGTY